MAFCSKSIKKNARYLDICCLGFQASDIHTFQFSDYSALPNTHSFNDSFSALNNQRGLLPTQTDKQNQEGPKRDGDRTISIS